MSAILMGRSTWLQGISCAEKMVLVAIADVSDDNGLAYMLIDTLMQKSSLSRRGVQNALSGLLEKGVLLRKERKHRSSIFKIVVEKLPLGRPPASDRELSDDHFWDNIEGARPAPSKRSEGAQIADEGAQIADEGARRAHIHPVTTPVETPDSLPSLREGTSQTDLLGDPVSTSKAIAPVDPRGSLTDYVAERWKELSSRYQRIPRVLSWTDTRKKEVIARAAEIVKASGGTVDAYQVWDRMFEAIAADAWLRGESEPGRNYRNAFVVDIKHILNSKNFLKILEKAEVNDADNRYTTDRDGNRFGPGAQTYHDTLRVLQRSGLL